MNQAQLTGLSGINWLINLEKNLAMEEDYLIPEKKKKIRLRNAADEWKNLEQQAVCPCVFSVYEKIKK